VRFQLSGVSKIWEDTILVVVVAVAVEEAESVVV